MASSRQRPTRVTLLSLPDDVLSKIFKHLSITTKYTLQSTTDAINLAKTNNRLHRIFSQQLTHITPLVANRHADTLSSEHLETLIRTAGENLRELHLPDCRHKYLHELPRICPNLESLSFVERYHVSIELAPFDTDDEDEVVESDGNDVDEDDLGDENASDDDVNDNEENYETGEVDINDNNATEANSYENVISESYAIGNTASNTNVCDNNVSAADADNNDVFDKNNGGYDADDDDCNQAIEDDSPVAEDDVSSDRASCGCADADNSDVFYKENGGYDAGDDDFNQAIEGDSPVAEDDANSDHASYSCPVSQLLPRLNLRKLSVVRLPEKLCDSIMNRMAGHCIQELHLYRMRKFQLPLLVPLLSLPLKALTITMSRWHYDGYSVRISNFVEALIPAVSHIPEVTVHFPGEGGLATIPESLVHFDILDFLNLAPALIASVRQNKCESKCTSIDLAGEGTFGILSAVDRNASVTLSSDKVTVCDQGEGIHITSVPLYEEFLDEDLRHLEKVYIVQRWDIEGEELIEYGWDPEWTARLAGQRLRLIRSYDADVLNRLQLSTERLELFCYAIAGTSDWTFLNGVKELHLLALPTVRVENQIVTIDGILKALPQIVDAFNGEFIAAFYPENPDCSDYNDPLMLVEHAIKAKAAILRFIRRGGDAATLCRYVDTVLNTFTLYMNNG